MKKRIHSLRVNLGKRSYSIKIGYGILTDTGSLLENLGIGREGFIITNRTINRLHGKCLVRSLRQKGFYVRTITVADSETSKSYRIFSNLIEKIASEDKGVRPFIIAFGGGVIGDLAGFIAASYRRGVPLVQIPTTLVAQVDSSIGGKVAIDLPIAKNMVGAFYQPKIVITDVSLLNTLPLREIECGLSEIIKYAVIQSKSFFKYLERNMKALKRLQRTQIEYVTRRCCRIKANVVSVDEKDTKGVRAILNFGHTVGHAIEAASGYKGAYNHGEAVAIGMVAAARIAQKLGMVTAADVERMCRIIKKAGLPVRTKGVNAGRILKSLSHDKKFIHRMNRFVLPTEIGSVKLVNNVPIKYITESIREITL